MDTFQLERTEAIDCIETIITHFGLDKIRNEKADKNERYGLVDILSSILQLYNDHIPATQTSILKDEDILFISTDMDLVIEQKNKRLVVLEKDVTEIQKNIQHIGSIKKELLLYQETSDKYIKNINKKKSTQLQESSLSSKFCIMPDRSRFIMIKKLKEDLPEAKEGFEEAFSNHQNAQNNHNKNLTIAKRYTNLPQSFSEARDYIRSRNIYKHNLMKLEENLVEKGQC